MGELNRNLSINGAGSSCGGEFDHVRISGAGVINGDLKCYEFSGSGSAKVNGNIVCDSFEVSGAGKIFGNVSGRTIHISGACKIEGDLEGQEISVTGAGKILGGIKAEKVTASGAITVAKNIEAEEIWIDGAIKHEGFMNAEKVVIRVMGAGMTYFNEIGATKVTINDDSFDHGILSKLIGMFTGTKGNVSGNLIEADTIAIERVCVKELRGGNIKVGPNCEVDRVECSGELEIHETAVVKEIHRV
ncbi:MAG: hypothetical protein AB9856_21730 [Cellulosilyticaceae bacterium]